MRFANTPVPLRLRAPDVLREIPDVFGRPFRGEDADRPVRYNSPLAMWLPTWMLLSAAALLPAQTGDLAVLLKGTAALAFVDKDGKVLAHAPVTAHPHEMVFSADGRYLFTTDNGTMTIEQAGTGGNFVSIIDVKARKKVGEINLGKYRRPHGIDLDRATGTLYVTTELPDQLLAIDTKTRAVKRTYETGGKTAHMVVLGPGAKHAYISHSNSANIGVIELSSGKVKLRQPASGRRAAYGRRTGSLCMW